MKWSLKALQSYCNCIFLRKPVYIDIAINCIGYFSLSFTYLSSENGNKLSVLKEDQKTNDKDLNGAIHGFCIV